MVAYSYARVSTAEQAAEGTTSIATQLDVCANVARLHNVEVAETFIDAGVSGSIPVAERAAGARLLAAAKAGDFVIVAKFDRLSRDLCDALNVAKMLKARGVHLVLRDVSADPITKGANKALFGMLGIFAEMERDRIAERMADGRAGKLASGGHAGGSAPFGWSVEGAGKAAKRVLNPAEQAIIARAVELKASGLSLRAISAELGPVSRAGTHFTASAVAALL